MAGTIEKKLRELGITLQEPRAPIANYVGFVRTGNMLTVSGQLCLDGEGKLVAKGQLGGGVSVEDGQKAARACAINSPWRVSRARPRCSAIRDSVAIMVAGSGPEPRTSTSRPLSVVVIWISSGFPIDISGSAIAHAASSAPRKPGSRIGQRSTGTMSCEFAAENPTLSTSWVPIRA